jgi:hypothetical protein
MAITLTGTAGLFNRLGVLFAGAEDILATQGGPATARTLAGANWVTRAGTAQAAYGAAPANQSTIEGIWSQLRSWQGSSSAFLGQLRTFAQNTVMDMADADVHLSQRDLPTALGVLFAQMRAAAQTVRGSAVAAGAQTAVGTPNGNPVLLLSLKTVKGATLDTVFPETLTFACTGDSQGSATLGREPVSVKGFAGVDTLAYNWPLGSGANATLTAVDALQNNGGGNANLLTNGSFEAFSTANYPDNWTAGVGAAGTQVLNGGSGNAYDGTAVLQFAGDVGGTLTAAYQPFNTAANTAAGAGGTPAKLSPDTVYHWCLFYKVSATPTAGVLEVALTDGTGTVVNDDAGTANLTTRTLTTATTAYASLGGAFRTPAILPAVLRLRVRLSTAIDNGKSVFVDRLAFHAPQQLYTGGPYASVFSGANKLISGDSWTVALTNTYGRFTYWFERMFGLRALGLVLPSATPGAETVLDSLIA